MKQKPEIVRISKLFMDVKYEIPIYQRNYAWEEDHIQQLIDDIDSSDGTYFLGSLIVNQKDTHVYEVIDGQQRLTTLYLLQRYLQMVVLDRALYFEARDKSNRTLEIIGTKRAEDVLEDLQSEELNRGYRIIEKYFSTEKIDPEIFKEKLHHVLLIRIQVPRKIDLNHYFEIMNTRGEQLELHEIAKARLLSTLSTDEDKQAAAIIWEACSKMDTYIQMNVDIETRKRLFTDDWSALSQDVINFDDVKEKILQVKTAHPTIRRKSLIEILNEKSPTSYEKEKTEEENERFESIISFPNFLLQVNEAMAAFEADESLDDKNFLKILEKNWTDEGKAKEFLFHLFKCRVLFDKYIVKREFAKDYKETGEWSLQRLKAYQDGKNQKPNYVSTFDNLEYNKKLRTLQSALRITYTSPKTMHWISLTLRRLLNDEDVDILSVLEDYGAEKVRESEYETASGFGFERIVFTYLDYLLYRDGYSYKDRKILSPLPDKWQFQFRNSIEHFYPQNPLGNNASKYWSSEEINSFGNLALINVSGNSKFSNLPPDTKVRTYGEVIEQSLKLIIMKKMIEINGGEWSKEIAEEHRLEMFDILKENTG